MKKPCWWPSATWVQYRVRVRVRMRVRMRVRVSVRGVVQRKG